MKKLTTLALILCFTLGQFAIAQEADTSKVRFGKKKYTIIVDDDKDIQIITDDVDNLVIRDKKKNRKPVRRMNGTWDGLELGLTNFANMDNQLAKASDTDFMELDLGQSWGVNLNFAEKSLGLAWNYFGLVTGMGIGYDRYMLANDFKISEVDGMMTGLPLDHDLNKNKLSVFHLNVPLMAELQIPVYGENNRIKIAAGVIGGVKLYSRQVQRYEINGEKQKTKTRDGFNLRDFRYGFTTRIAYGDMALFANYYPQTLFKEGMGPDILPVTVGIHLGGN